MKKKAGERRRGGERRQDSKEVGKHKSGAGKEGGEGGVKEKRHKGGMKGVETEDYGKKMAWQSP